MDSGRFAARAFGGCAFAGLFMLTLIGLLFPAQFGAPGARAFRSGWPVFALLGMIAVCAVAVYLRRDYVLWLWARFREPLVRPLEEDPAFEGAAAALGECPAPLKTRFALTWVWAPSLLAILGALFSISASYFVVDAVLARFRIGWGQGVLVAVNVAAALLVFRAAALKLSTWRVALSAYRDATGGYS